MSSWIAANKSGFEFYLGKIRIAGGYETHNLELSFFTKVIDKKIHAYGFYMNFYHLLFTFFISKEK